jgi:diadenosine tetraphosphate (Ap4A) HIT family hydrolase
VTTEVSSCLTCRSNSGEERISPGPTIYEGQYWFVEHGYPAALKGWLVVALKRHVEAIHELEAEELAELSLLLGRASQLLRAELACEKEYVCCLSEMEHFRHVHFHIVAKPRNLPPSLSGKLLLLTLRTTAEEAAPASDIRAFCERLRDRFGELDRPSCWPQPAAASPRGLGAPARRARRGSARGSED